MTEDQSDAPSEGDELEFSYAVDVAALGRARRAFQLETNEEQRARVAERLGMLSIEQFSGGLQVTATKAVIKISGDFSADLTRECVASLEPMNERVEEAFQIELLRSALSSVSDSFSPQSAQGDENSWDGADVAPETHEGDTLDLGELLVQQLSLAMDPFPRKPGAISLAERYAPPENVSPFAALQGLVKKK